MKAPTDAMSYEISIYVEASGLHVGLDAVADIAHSRSRDSARHRLI